MVYWINDTDYCKPLTYFVEITIGKEVIQIRLVERITPRTTWRTKQHKFAFQNSSLVRQIREPVWLGPRFNHEVWRVDVVKPVWFLLVGYYLSVPRLSQWPYNGGYTGCIWHCIVLGIWLEIYCSCTSVLATESALVRKFIFTKSVSFNIVDMFLAMFSFLLP